MSIDLSLLDTFGEVAAEDDKVLLEHFLSTPAHRKVANGEAILVLGRKGAGKTALVRACTERPGQLSASSALRFGDYPWKLHADHADAGASEVESFLASWEYLIAVHLSLLTRQVIGTSDDPVLKKLENFLQKNYGKVGASVADTLQPKSLVLEGSFEPTILGNKLGRIDFRRVEDRLTIGRELAATSAAILDAVTDLVSRHLPKHRLLLHFDELDLGLSTIDPQRSLMLTGLVLAARAVRRRLSNRSVNVFPVVYLRSDIWDMLNFSDKNKITESSAIEIRWTSDELKQLVERRASAKLGREVTWADLADGDKMRGTQDKWRHIVQRTYLRPRDAIKFCNVAFGNRSAVSRKLTNDDITSARQPYSTYLKRELDDEIRPHWPSWDKCLDVLSALQNVTFDPKTFQSEARKEQLGLDVAAALERLYEFSVLGYRRSKGHGGSEWVFRYETPGARWDPGASVCKVHLGLKEFCRLKEERRPGTTSDKDGEDYWDSFPDPFDG